MTPATDGSQLAPNRLVPIVRPVVVTAPVRLRTAGWITVRSVTLALVFLGIGLRFVTLIQNRNLWIDEAMLALNLVERSPRQLLEPLDWNQGAPIGFLLCVKAVIGAFGSSEWALRLVPFAGSVLGFLGFAWLARRLLSPQAAVLAIGLFAISPYLITYAAECKQYSTDAALTVGLFAVALGLLQPLTGRPGSENLNHLTPHPPSLGGKGEKSPPFPRREGGPGGVRSDCLPELVHAGPVWVGGGVVLAPGCIRPRRNRDRSVGGCGGKT